MRVADIGEFGLIELLSKELGIPYPPSPDALPRPGLLVDMGDDALVTGRHDAATILTTDTMVAGVHFLPERVSWRDIGWKALAVNVSDIAAMGGEPSIALVTLSLPPEFLIDDAIAIYTGLQEAAMKHAVVIGGGDIVRSPVFSVTVALSGTADLSELGQPRAMTRHAARPGDVVAVTGSLGDSAGGLQLLIEGQSSNSDAVRYLRLRHQRPEPRVQTGRVAVKAGVRCGMDVSDGLAQDLAHIARASDVAIRVDAARVPVSDALREVFSARALGLALTGGEDYELVLVAPAAVIESVRQRSDVAVTEIGEVLPYHEGPRVAVVDEAGRDIPFGEAGWDHFQKR
jgi:thiamine-monophosphate kinase